ncbi:acyl-[acyl-carrier-protein] thioesterase [Cecembia lonarensis]|uniref:Acyl-ACP thioesterase n=1 Tax=Cecembia lonarensis (strain CCUG 58316 / KCTC 22772 / LW9) TaxID=1225176 RepID=K1LL76_CECL9|nr:acyl-ACP thioesterase domain-containing protein [Cecembia lonarensis]EKB51133.1 Acyl-ACP thioesterase [Cecembia lonarensis LW9]
MKESSNKPFQFQKTFEILSFQIDPSGKLRWAALADLLQEVAWKHADSREFGQVLFDKGFMWVLSRFDIQVHAMPSWGETIHIETAGRGINKLFALREFRVTDSSGTVLATAMSAWLLLDIKTKRPQRPSLVLPSELFETEPSDYAPPEKISVPEKGHTGKTFHVNHSDLDMNNHVNNVSYIRWIEDFCLEQGFTFDKISINYLNEALLGENIEILFSLDAQKMLVSGRSGERDVFTSWVEKLNG